MAARKRKPYESFRKYRRALRKENRLEKMLVTRSGKGKPCGRYLYRSTYTTAAGVRSLLPAVNYGTRMQPIYRAAQGV